MGPGPLGGVHGTGRGRLRCPSPQHTRPCPWRLPLPSPSLCHLLTVRGEGRTKRPTSEHVCSCKSLPSEESGWSRQRLTAVWGQGLWGFGSQNGEGGARLVAQLCLGPMASPLCLCVKTLGTRRRLGAQGSSGIGGLGFWGSLALGSCRKMRSPRREALGSHGFHV